MKRLVVALWAAVAFGYMASPARAENGVGPRIAAKAIRGLENATLGFVTEVPKTIYQDSVDRGIAYGATVGAVRGIGVGMLRTGIGVYEIATFPLPVPEGYRPMLYPELPHDFREETQLP